MKFPRYFSVFIGLLFSLGLAAAIWFFNKSPKPNPVNFIQHTYSELYHANSTFSSLDKAHEIYSSTLLGLIRTEQQQQIKSEEIGKLSADPLCNCQDPTAVQILEITNEFEKDDHATIFVTLSVSGTHQKLRLDLIREAGFWKIDDVMGEQISSLRDSLIKN